MPCYQAIKLHQSEWKFERSSPCSPGCFYASVYVPQQTEPSPEPSLFDVSNTFSLQAKSTRWCSKEERTQQWIMCRHSWWDWAALVRTRWDWKKDEKLWEGTLKAKKRHVIVKLKAGQRQMGIWDDWYGCLACKSQRYEFGKYSI